MRGDFTRDTRERARRSRTRAVLLQQGRQLLDADWNEQAGLVAEREEQLARHVIGRQGAPRDDAGFAIAGAAGNFSIGAGSLYAEGLQLLNPASTTYTAQLPPDLLPSLALQNVLPDGQEGLVYLEAVLRPASSIVDPSLVEPALAGADTVVREHPSWVVRVAPLAGIGMTRAQLVEALERNRPVTLAPWAVATGGLDAEVQTEDEATDPGPCEMPASAGYLDQLNRLYRVEIHTSGAAGVANFKWTEDAGREAGLRAEGAGFAIDLPIARAADWFPIGAIVEVLEENQLRSGRPGPIGAITSAPGAALQINGVAAAALSANVLVRRWANLPVAVPAGGAWVALSKGIKIRFAAGQYVAGAAWTIPGRTLIGDILWPPYPTADFSQNVGGSSVPFYLPTEGRRRYAALALLRRNGGNYSVTEDVRQLFPPLTDITASDVRYDDSATGLGADDVQEAIEALAQRGSACCTYEVRPGPSWTAVFEKIPKNSHATICFAPGNYELNAPVEIARYGHLRLRGSGPGSKIWCYGATSAIRFSDCASVEITDILVAAERQAPAPKRAPAESKTDGVLEFLRCGPLRIQRATLISGGRRWRQASCLRIEAPADRSVAGSGDVIVEDCDIVPGDLSTGVLVLNGADVAIRNNRIRPRNEDPQRTWRRWADDGTIAAAMGRLLFSHAVDAVDADKRTRPVARADLRLFFENTANYPRVKGIHYYGWTVISENDWAEFLRLHAQDMSRSDSRTIRLDIRKIVSNLWASAGSIRVGGQDFSNFKQAVRVVQDTIAPVIDAAIVVAGRVADNVAVTGNKIDGVVDGVRVALSNGGDRQRLRAQTVRVEGNRIRLRAAPIDIVRHGVMIGNVERCWLVDNDIAYETAESDDSTRMRRVRGLRLDGLHAEGVRVFGSLGPVVHMRGNSVRLCPAAFTLTAVKGTDSGAKQWLVQGNYAGQARLDYRLDERCQSVNNV